MTVASRLMLPCYVVTFVWIGLNYLITAKARLIESPTLRYVDTVIDLRALGILLTVSGVLMAAALITRRRDPARYTLILAGICFGILFLVFSVATFQSEASPSAPAWPFLGLCACTASYRSITRYET
jgi:heme/copper-type cytochrome/quinol oxidase subunit 3